MFKTDMSFPAVFSAFSCFSLNKKSAVMMPIRRRSKLGAFIAFIALFAVWQQRAFIGSLRAAALAGVLATGVHSDAATAHMADFAPMDSSIVLAEDLPVSMGGKAGGGLEGTYTMKAGAKKKDFIDDEKFIKADEKFSAKFDEYVGVFGILFVGAFIAPMVTYFWYVRDSDPWENWSDEGVGLPGEIRLLQCTYERFKWLECPRCSEASFRGTECLQIPVRTKKGCTAAILHSRGLRWKHCFHESQ